MFDVVRYVSLSALIFEIAIVITAYAIGSVIFGVILARYASISDPRIIGSGNIGATNIARIGGWKLGVMTAVLDAMKGFFAVAIAQILKCSDVIVALSMISVVLGHIFPIWCGFRGGKAVATMAGVSFALSWILGVTFISCWIAIFLITKISSVASISSVMINALMCCVLFVLQTHNAFTDVKIVNLYVVVSYIIISALIVIRHKNNIKNLIYGTEQSFKATSCKCSANE